MKENNILAKLVSSLVAFLLLILSQLPLFSSDDDMAFRAICLFGAIVWMKD